MVRGEDQNNGKETDYPIWWLDKRIAGQLANYAKQNIWRVLYLCVDRKAPARVAQVNFKKNSMQALVQWPLELDALLGNWREPLGTKKRKRHQVLISRPPIQTPLPEVWGEPLDSKRDLARFRQAFRKYLMGRDFGWEVTKILYPALCRALLRHLKIYRLSAGRLKHSERLREPDELWSHLIRKALVGKLSHLIPEHEEKSIRQLAHDVRNVVAEMRKSILAWQKEAKDAVNERLMEKYDTDAHPWMRHFGYFFKTMTVSTARTPRLADLSSWKAAELRQAIIKGWLRLSSGSQYDESEIARISRRQTRKRR